MDSFFCYTSLVKLVAPPFVLPVLRNTSRTQQQHPLEHSGLFGEVGLGFVPHPWHDGTWMPVDVVITGACSGELLEQIDTLYRSVICREIGENSKWLESEEEEEEWRSNCW